MLSVRARLSSVVSKRTFATAAEAKKPVDQKFKVVVVGGGPGGLSGIVSSHFIFIGFACIYTKLKTPLISFIYCLEVAR